MVLLGAGGHAKELIELLVENYRYEHIVIFDNITPSGKIPYLFKNNRILKSEQELKQWFLNNTNEFVLGVGGIQSRSILWNIGLRCGGNPISLAAKNSMVGRFDTKIKEGTTIMQMAFVSNSVTIGKGALINTRVNIHHDVVIGDFCEIAPNASLLGRVKIGNSVFIGAGAIILPDVVIGNNCVVGAGSVVTKDLSENMVVKGNPAK